jgi:hypothetical protein
MPPENQNFLIKRNVENVSNDKKKDAIGMF